MFYEIEIIDDVRQMIIDPIEIPEREITEDFDIQQLGGKQNGGNKERRTV